MSVLADVVVIGSGAAGLTAALRAAVGGARVVVLEKSRLFGGTSAMSGGILWMPNNRWMREAGLSDSREEALTYIRRLTLGRVSDVLIETFVDQCNGTAEFLEREARVVWQCHVDYPDYQPELPGGKPRGRGIFGGPYERARLGEYAGLLRRGPGGRRLDLDRVEASADRRPATAKPLDVTDAPVVTAGRALVGQLLEACMSVGVELRNRTRALELVQDAGRVSGVLADREGVSEALNARWGVVLASGGFEWNRDLIDRFLGVPLEFPSSSPTNTGDGLIMAMRVGTLLGNMTEAWWAPAVHVPGEEYEDGPMNRHISWPRCQPGSVMVNRRGRRFVNDAMNYNDVTKAMMVFDPATFDWANLPCWLVFDAEYRRTYDFAGVVPDMPDPDWVAKAQTLRELAQTVGIDPDGLCQQVTEFNKNAARGEDPAFHRGESAYDRYIGDRRRANPSLRPLGDGPYYALELRIGGMGTKGGPVIDPRGRVLAATGQPIRGLFASGNVVANVFGPSYPGPGSTLASGTTFARLAAETMIAEQATVTARV